MEQRYAAEISNTTFSGNSAAGTTSGAGGGVYKYDGEGTVTLQNSIIANSPSGGNCSGTIISNGYNLSSDNTCAFNHSGDFNNPDPMLGPLQNNGGPTQTMALATGSPAIDAGNPSGCTDGQGHLSGRTALIATLYEMYFRGIPKKQQAAEDIKSFGFKGGWSLHGLTSYLEKHPTAPTRISELCVRAQ